MEQLWRRSMMLAGRVAEAERVSARTVMMVNLFIWEEGSGS